MAKPVLLRILLGILLLLDTGYTYRQNLGKPLDGDIVPIVLPSPHYQKVLADPLGFRAIGNDEHYAAPNRYFAHATMRFWYRDVYEATAVIFPDPIGRLYILSALFNTFTQLLLVFLLSVCITGHARFWRQSFLLSAVLLTPLFQVHGMYDVIGIVDQAVSYTFFYAFPLAMLLLYFLPVYLSWRRRRPMSGHFGLIGQAAWALLAVYLAFSGPLIQPLVLLLLAFMALPVFSGYDRIRSIPRTVFVHGGWLLLLCTYSFYLGTYNAENLVDLPLAERYLKLAFGIGHVLYTQGVLPVLLGWLLLNAWLARRFSLAFSPLTRRQAVWIFIFVTAYILLLPLGGYRSYRPLVIRYDTFMPVTLILIWCCGLSAWMLLLQLPGRIRRGYAIIVTGILIFFSFRDNPRFGDRDCQRESLFQIRDAQEPVIYVGNGCTELTWWAGYDTAGTRNISEMLYQWGITDHYQAFGGEKP